MEQNDLSAQAPIQPEIKKSRLGIKVAGGVLLILVLAGLVFYKVYAGPNKVWQKFSEQIGKTPLSVEEDFKISYQDNGKEIDPSNQLAEVLNNLHLGFSGTAYVNYKNPDQLQSDIDINYTVGSKKSSFNSGIQFKLIGQEFYLNLGDNPFFANLLSDYTGQEGVFWIKLDLKAVEEAAKTENLESSAFSTSLQEQIKIYQEMLNKRSGKIIILDRYLGWENLRNVPVLHFSNKVNKDELKSLGLELIRSGFNQAERTASSAPYTIETEKAITRAIELLIDKTQVSNLETWVGSKDFLLHKIKFTLTVPSINSITRIADEPAVFGTDVSPVDTVEKIFEKISFDGVLSVEEEFYNYGKEKPVIAPEKFIDLMDIFKKQQQSQTIIK